MRRTLAVLAMVFGLVLGTPLVASASSDHFNGFGPRVSYQGVGVSMGTYYSHVSGDGTWVQNVQGWPYINTPVGNICNWEITAEFFDTQNRWLETLHGGVHLGCWWYGNQATGHEIPVNRNMPSGMVCTTLKSNGVRLTSNCHTIHP